MNIPCAQREVRPEKWARYRWNLTTNLGENGSRITGCDKHIALAHTVAQEGMVLLENNGLLPLKDGTTVSLFGIGSIDYVKSGLGSGTSFPAYTRNIYEGFLCKSPRIAVYEPVTKYYYDYATSHSSEYADKNPLFSEMLFEEIAFPKELVVEASKVSDVAIVTLHRCHREGMDRYGAKGDFYLSDTEQQLIADVTAQFKHTVIVLNIGAVMDVSWIKETPGIDAVLLAWYGGMEGGLAIADVVCGDVNPSGKLADTFAKSLDDYYGVDTFFESEDYVNYVEDIYVGYRYFETIPGAADKVIYPFGYGLSYTTFALSSPTAVQIGDEIEITVSVRNTGTVAGKEVVQVYFSAPQGRLGKSAVSLASFQKTRLLAPNEEQKVKLRFPISYMASYDDLGKCQASAYVLEKGDYRILVGTSCRDLQETAYRYTVTEDYVVVEQLEQRCAPNKLSHRLLADGTLEALPAAPIKEYDPPAWVNPALSGRVEGLQEGIISSDLLTPWNESAAFEKKAEPYPLSAVANGKITLDQFLTQMTDEELIKIVSGIPNRGTADALGMGGIDRLGIPPVMTADGPTGLRISPKTGIAVTAFPCATLIACTWDPDLAEAVGAAGGMECKENGIGMWLTPALNIHRNPLCGRNFEYFSEDPLISGKFAAAEVRGIQSTHTVPAVKHFATNNKEINRKFSDSRLSERALREIYLKGFEICVKESDPWMMMTSYNLINARRVSECYELLTDILRGEWGYQGMLTTDWGAAGEQVKYLKAGNDIRMPSGFPDLLREALENGTLKRGHFEVCAKRILQMILKLD